jgi:peptide/nickel transport system permease protein
VTAYIVRRILYAVPVLVGVNVIVFALFFFVNTPDRMAMRHLGEKRVTPEQIDKFKREHNLDLPYFYNSGWRRLGSVSAEAESNAGAFRAAGAGRYALVIEAPQNVKEAMKAGKRRVRVECSHPARLSLPDEFSAEGVVELEPGTEPVTFSFTLAPGDETTLDLTLGFDLASPGLRHRVALDHKGPTGFVERFTRTLFWQHSFRMLFFKYGKSMQGRPIGGDILKRMVPSLTLTVPAFIGGLVLTIFFAMMLALLRGTYVDYWGVVMCVFMMSISGLFYILGGQFLVGKVLRLVPVSGYDYGLASWKFVILPVVVAIVGGVGGGVRFYRTIFLEEINKDYVRTARAKGLPERTVLFVHVLKNAMIPILTSVVVRLPFLITGSLLLETFFAIPGLGSYTLDAVRGLDFIVVQAMVSLGAFLYVIALLANDISYTLVDPRVRLE